MTQQDLALSAFAPAGEVIRPLTRVIRGKFPCIDAHNHIMHWTIRRDAAEAVPRLLDLMDACNIQAIFDLRYPPGDPVEEALAVLKPRDRFYVLASLPLEKLAAEGEDFGRRACEILREQFRRGADGLKMYKSVGLTLRDRAGRLIHYDDDRLAPVFEACAEFGRPCLFHIADPTAFFKPLDRFNERWEELHGHPTWHFHGPQYPTFMELMEVQDRLVGKYPDVKFQSAHVCSYAEDLAFVSDLLARHPNLHCDISARIGELGRVPRAAREFFSRYQDRILFGTDVAPRRELYEIHYRFLETADEYFDYGDSLTPGQGRWCIYGMNLPDEVLRKVYADNAIRLYGTPRG